MACAPTALPKMMLGFVVRRCSVEMGHFPSAEEFTAWANYCREGDRVFKLFGRLITVDEARLILRHPARVVSARGAAPHECVLPDEDIPAKASLAEVISLAAVRARMKAR